MVESRLFEPIRVGRADLKHRIAMAPLTRLRADENHTQPPMAQEYYAQRASVPGTLLIAEAILISPAHGGMPHGPALWNDTHVESWKAITDAVHAKGSSIICQLVAPGRAADAAQLAKDGGHVLLSSTATPMPGSGFAPKDSGPAPIPREMTESEIWSCVSDFASAAQNAIRAGFDGVEIHGANGYLVDQFLQDTCNTRTDAWGGSPEARSRFGVEVARAVSAAIGADRVGFRVSPWSEFQGMRMADPEPTFTYLAHQLKKLGLGYLHIIEARVNNNVDIAASESIEFLLRAWDNATPVLLAGGYTPENAIHAVDNKYSAYDVVVVFGRLFLANPDLPYRIRHGIALNEYDRNTFYAVQSPKGYADYPFCEGFVPGAEL
jgi:NADPH2 dehydrogenase